MQQHDTTLEERVGGALSTNHVLYAYYADLPTQGVLSGATAWIYDGRKTGEASGHGSGVPAYADTQAGTTTWRRQADDSAVVI